MKHAVQHIHMVGIGGSGMSPIAEILQRQGFKVSGSDLQASDTTRRLQSLGVQVCIGHDAAHIAGAQAVAISTAVAADNPEVLAARAQHIPVVPRALLLAELMRHKIGIAVAGTHGKTTTTSLLASVLLQAGVDPTFVIGGKLHSAGSNARAGQGEHIVVEADESDASFLHLNPIVSIVTNIDADHMDTYGHDLQRLHQTFVDFIHRLPFYGRAVMCVDDAGVQAVLPQVQRPLTTYGQSAAAQLRAVEVRALPSTEAGGGRMSFVARQAGHPDLPLMLNLAGLHNVNNALAVLAVARELGLPDASTAHALDSFAGVGRRFESHGELATADGGYCTLIDDYGHHPVELAAVIAAARGAFPGRRLLLAFQPHRYTRTRDCFGDFVAVLATADAVLLTEVYAAGEAPIAGADGQALAQALQAKAATGRGASTVGFAATLPELHTLLTRTVRDGDVLITLGAGSIGQLPALLTRAKPTAVEGAAA
jgi:UDP-N-acetylmuramate--alanine ligase